MRPTWIVALLDAPQSSSVAVQCSWLMLHFLWQGAAIGVLVFIMNTLAARRSAQFRYSVAVMGLFAMLACVAVTWLSMQPKQPAPISIAQSLSNPTFDLTEQTAAFELATTVDVLPPEASSALPLPPTSTTTSRLTSTPTSTIETWAPTAMLIYTTGVALMLLRLAISAIGVGRLQRLSQPVADQLARRVENLAEEIGLRVKPSVTTCERLVVPFVVGVLKPTILLPPAALSGMTNSELEAILVHELAHIRRCDPLINWIQRIAEALLFFHPALWYVSRVITVERENSCDDIVLGTCQRDDYARALIRLAELCTNEPTEYAPIAALAATGARPSELRRRLMRILDVAPMRSGMQRPGAGMLIACAIAATATAVHLHAQTNTTSDAQQRPPVQVDAANQRPQLEDVAGDENSADAGFSANDDNEQPVPAWGYPIVVYLDQAASGARFSVKADGPGGIRQLTEIARHLETMSRVEIESMQIVREDARTVMTIKGQNIDFRAIKAATNRAKWPLVKKLIEELEAKGLTNGGPPTNTADTPNLPPQPPQVELSASGEAIIMRGDKQQAERIARIIAQIEMLTGTNGPSGSTPPLPETPKLPETPTSPGIAAALPPTPPRATNPEPATPVEPATPAAPTDQRRQLAEMMQTQLQQLKQRQAELTEYYVDQHPTLTNIRNSIRQLEAAVAEFANTTQQGLPTTTPPSNPTTRTAPQNAVSSSKTGPPKITGPLRFEFIEGTDIILSRGRKKDVDMVMKAIEKLRAAAETTPEPNAPPKKEVPKHAGQELFMQHCAHCHGKSGQGDGPTARFLSPVPADLADGDFNRVDVSGSQGKQNLQRLLVTGIPGTAMPSFARLSHQESGSLAEYVQLLSARGETSESGSSKKPQSTGASSRLNAIRQFQKLRSVAPRPQYPNYQRQGHLRFPIEVERAMMGDQVRPVLPKSTPFSPSPSLPGNQIESPFRFPIEVERGMMIEGDQPKR